MNWGCGGGAPILHDLKTGTPLACDPLSRQVWQEDNIAPQFVFEVLSPSNTQTEMNKKQICRGEWPFAPTGILFSRTSLTSPATLNNTALRVADDRPSAVNAAQLSRVGELP